MISKEVNMTKPKKKSKKILQELHVAFDIFNTIHWNEKMPDELADALCNPDYAEFMSGRDFADLYRIEEKFELKEYNSFCEVMTDIRRVFLNVYSFYGVRSKITAKALVIEEMLEHKISLLPTSYQTSADIQLALNLVQSDNTPEYKYLYPKGCYDSKLLRSVAHCRPERLKKYYSVLNNRLAKDEHGTVLLEELLKWEIEICFNNNYDYISSMYEVLEIGNMLSIVFGYYGVEIIHQGVIERMFLIPKESTTMNKIMTMLLKCNHKSVPYEVWSVALKEKVSEWYKVYHSMKRCKIFVFQVLGIHPDFWAAIGDRNPLLHYDYCDLPYFMKVWIVKGLCDHLVDKNKTIHKIIMNSKERQCTVWKNETGTEEYFYFKSMPDLRLYYMQIPYEEPDLEFLKEEEVDEEDKDGAAPWLTGVHVIFPSKLRVKPDKKNFKLIADSVQAMRSFIEKLVIEDKPESLISSLEELLDEFEPHEANVIIENNVAKIKIYEDWKSYYEKTQKECQSQADVSQKPVNPTCNKESNNTCDNSNLKDESKVVNQPENLNSSVAQSVHNKSNKPNEQNVKSLKKRKKPSEEMKNPDNLEDAKNKKHKTGTCENNKNDLTESNDQITKQLCNTRDKKIKILTSWTEGSSAEKPSNDNQLTAIDNQSSNSFCCNKDITAIKALNTTILVEDNRLKVNDSENKERLINQSKRVNFNNAKELIPKELYTKDINQSKMNDDIEVINKNSNNSENEKKTTRTGINKTTTNSNVSLTKNKNNKVNIVISNDEYDVQIVSVRQTPNVTPVRCYKNVQNTPNASNKQLVSTNRNTQQAQLLATNNMSILSNEVSIIPVNGNKIPKNNQKPAAMKQQSTITPNYNVTKRQSTTTKFNTSLTEPVSSLVNVKCEVVPRPCVNGEIKFSVRLPNGHLHPVADELINQYLKEHNNSLPHYWIVPLPKEVAKKYGC